MGGFFEFQQGLLALESSGVSREGAVDADNAVTGHEDAQRVRSDGLADLLTRPGDTPPSAP